MRRFMRKNRQDKGATRRLWGSVVALLLVAWPGIVAAESRTVTLGASLQLSGAFAPPGRNLRDGYQITVDRINESGGLTIGEDTYRLTLKVLDNQSDLALSARQYSQLIVQEKADVLLGPYSSKQTFEASAIAEQHQMLMVAGAGATRQVISRGYKYLFGTAPTAENYFNSTIEMMTKLDPRPRTMALVVADDLFDTAIAEGARARAGKEDIDIVVDRRYGGHDTDVATVLAQVKAKSPDAIFWSGPESGALHFMREAKNLNVSPRHLSSVTIGVPSASFRTALGKDAEYAFGMTPWLPSPLLRDRWFGDAQQFAKLFQRRFGYEPDYHVAAAAAAVETLAYALETAGTMDSEKLRAAVAQSNFESLYATIRFPSDGQIDPPQIVVQVQDGKVVPIYTDHFLNKPRYPVPGWSNRN